MTTSPLPSDPSSQPSSPPEEQTPPAPKPPPTPADLQSAKKISTLQLKITTLTSQIASTTAQIAAIAPQLTSPDPPATIVNRHIRLLHEYNEMRDIGQGLMGIIAENRGVRAREVYEEFGVEEGD